MSFELELIGDQKWEQLVGVVVQLRSGTAQCITTIKSGLYGCRTHIFHPFCNFKKQLVYHVLSTAGGITQHMDPYDLHNP